MLRRKGAGSTAQAKNSACTGFPGGRGGPWRAGVQQGEGEGGRQSSEAASQARRATVSSVCVLRAAERCGRAPSRERRPRTPAAGDWPGSADAAVVQGALRRGCGGEGGSQGRAGGRPEAVALVDWPPHVHPSIRFPQTRMRSCSPLELRGRNERSRL